MNESFTLSVRLMTYNHEPFIREAMESIMSQKVNFNIEVVVGDDFSKDRTLDIIKTFRDRERIKIKILDRQIGDSYAKIRNEFGRLSNFVDIIQKCSGKYIALLDGDDFWIDPDKLQRQVDYMEKNPECVLTFTNRIEIDKKGNKIGNQIYEDKVYCVSDVLDGFIPPTQTIVLKNIKGLTDYLLCHLDSPSGDRMLVYYCSLFGKLKCLNFISAAYRHSGQGVWNSISSINQFFISLARFIEFHLTIGIRANNEIIHNRINGSVIYLIKKNPTLAWRNVKQIIQIKRKYGIKSHFLSYLLSKLFKTH